MAKKIVHQIHVKEHSESILFQIMLPRNAKRVISIGLTTDGKQSGDGIHEEVGSVWLWVAGVQDRVFADTVRVPLQSYDMLSYSPIQHLSFGSFQAWTDGTKIQPLSIEIDREVTMIEGFYRDELKDHFGGPYTVKIYLTIEL